MSHRAKIVYSGNSSRSKRLHEKVESTKKVAELQSKDVPKKKIKSSYVRWSEAEDMRLKYLQKVHGNRWDEIVKFFPGRTAKSIKIRYYGTLSRDPKPRTSLDMGSRHFVPGLQQHAMSPYQHIPGYTPSSKPYQYQLVSNLNRGNGAPHHKMPAAHGSSAMSSLLFASNQKMKLEASQQQQSNQTSSKPVELVSSDEDPGIDSEEEEKVSSTGSTSSSGVGL